MADSNADNAVTAPKYREYWAFISYSHRDKVWADWLHRRLETYRVPKKLIGRPNRTGQVPKRLYPIFRDREELPTSANLGSVISQALENSKYLVVICSPRSAASQWVNQEILAFKALGKADRVLALIVDGEPNASSKPGQEEQECFPEALRYELNADGTLSGQPAEPVAGDARPFADGKRNALFKLLAGLLGVDYAILNDREHKRRLVRTLVGATLVFTLAAGALGIWGVQEQRRLRDLQSEHQKTLEQRDRALRNLAGIYLHQAEQALERNQNGPALLHLAASLDSFDTLGARVAAGFALPGLVPELARWPLHDSSVQAMRVAEHQGTQLLVSAAMNGPLQVLRLRDLEPIANFEPVPWVSALASDARGRIIAAGIDGVRLLDPATGENQLLPELSAPGVMYRLSPDGTLATALNPTQGMIRLLSIPDGRVLAELTPEPLDWKPSGAMRFSNDGTKLAAGGTEGAVQVWSTVVAEDETKDDSAGETGNAAGNDAEESSGTNTKPIAPVAVFTGLESTVSALAFSADANLLAAGEGQFLGGPGTVEILVWNLNQEPTAPVSATSQPLARLKGHEQQINHLAFSQDGRLLASSSDADSQIRLWDVEAFNPELFDNPRFEFQPLAVLPQLARVTAMQFASGSALLVLGDSAGYARLLDTESVIGMRRQTPGPFSLTAAAPAADHLALLQPGGQVRVLEMSQQEAKQREIARFSVDPMTSALTISQDGREIAWAAGDRLLIKPMVDQPNHQRPDAESTNSQNEPADMPEAQAFALQGPVQALAFSPDASLVAVGGPGRLSLHERSSGNQLAHWEHPAGAAANMQAISFSQDGRFLALTTTAEPAVLNTADLTPQTIDTQSQGVFALTFVPATDSSPAVLLAACQDGLVRRWRLDDWQALEPLRGFEQLVATLAASADGQLVAATSGPMLQLWSAADSNLLHRERTNAIAIDALHFLRNGATLSWSSSYLNTLAAADLQRGPLPPLLADIHARLDLGLPYRLDQNGTPVARSPSELADQRLQAIIQGEFPWPIEKTGLSEAAFRRVKTLVR